MRGGNQVTRACASPYERACTRRAPHLMRACTQSLIRDKGTTTHARPLARSLTMLNQTHTHTCCAGKTHGIEWGFDVTGASITIEDTDSVVWVWNKGGSSSAQHNVASGAGRSHDGLFRSGNPTGAPDSKFTVDFSQLGVGEYVYFCERHATMVGTITVVAGQPPQKHTSLCHEPLRADFQLLLSTIPSKTRSCPSHDDSHSHNHNRYKLCHDNDSNLDRGRRRGDKVVRVRGLRGGVRGNPSVCMGGRYLRMLHSRKADLLWPVWPADHLPISTMRVVHEHVALHRDPSSLQTAVRRLELYTKSDLRVEPGHLPLLQAWRQPLLQSFHRRLHLHKATAALQMVYGSQSLPRCRRRACMQSVSLAGRMPVARV